MARATWTGSISFGLINVPVRLYPATRSRDVRFNQLHATDGGRIGYVKVCKVDNEPVPADEIVKGYEISKGEYVQMADEDFEAAAPDIGIGEYGWREPKSCSRNSELVLAARRRYFGLQVA